MIPTQQLILSQAECILNPAAAQVFTLSNPQPFPASYKWVLAEDCDPRVWSVTPASGQLGGPSTEEISVRWTPKANAPPGETEVSVHSPPAATLPFCCCCCCCLLVFFNFILEASQIIVVCGCIHMPPGTVVLSCGCNRQDDVGAHQQRQ